MAAPRKHEIPEIPAEFLTTLKTAPGKQFITANGLIYLGHLQGLKRVDVQIVLAPTKDNAAAIVRCEVETDLGVFSDYGEVSSLNKGAVGGTYPLSMATTRARNRALRIATGCPLTSYEEMGMETTAEEGGDEGAKPQTRPMQIVKESTPVAATAAHYTEMDRLAKQILDKQGKNLGAHITEDMSAVQAETLIKRFKATLEEGNAKSATVGGANPQQIDKIHKLQAALGRPAVVSSDLSSEEAGRQIAELVRIFNAQAKAGPQKAGTVR